MRTNILLYVIFIVFIILSCTNTSEENESLFSFKKSEDVIILNKMVEIGDSFELNKYTSNRILISSSETVPGVLVVYNMNFYILGVEKNVVVYIYTDDPIFCTDENLKIGSTLVEVYNKTQYELRKDRGFAYYIKLPSGWNAAFAEGSYNTNNEPKYNSKVKWFFKR